MLMKSTTSRTHKSGSALIGHIAAATAVAMWGYSFVSSKVLLENGLGPVQIYILRFLLAYIIVIFISHKRLFAASWKDEMLLAVCGMTSGSLYFIAENSALQYTLATNVSLLTSMSPLLTAVLLAMLYKHEKLGLGTWVGSALAIAGMACVVFNSSTNIQVRPLGDILSLAAAFSWAVYSIILRKISAGYDVWFISRKTFVYGLLTALPFLAFEKWPEDFGGIMCRGEVIGNMLFLGLGASTIGYVLWAVGVRNIGALNANNYMYFQSVVTLVVSYFVLHEGITIIGIVGIILIIGGLWAGDNINLYLQKRRSRVKVG